MQILFIMMTPLHSNTSAIMRMSGIIKGASLNGHTCDLITLQGSERDSHYDSFNDELERKHIRNYYKIPMLKVYSSFKSSNAKTTKKRSRVKMLIRNIALWGLKNFTVYEGSDINAKRIKNIVIDYNAYDQIVSVSDPKSSHKMVLELLKEGKVEGIWDKWIQCWGDPWASDMTRKHGLKLPLVKKEEAKILRLARKIVYTSPFTMEDQKKRYPDCADKMILVNQTVLSEKAADSIAKDKSLGYFGAYMSNIRNILPLYECCKENGYELSIAGKTDLDLKQTDGIKIYPKLSLAEVNELERKIGIIICLCNRFGTQIPGKIYYDAIAKKPIVIIVDGEHKEEMRKYFEGFQRFIICDNNIKSIKRAIEKAQREIDAGADYVLDDRFYPAYGGRMIFG